MRKHAKSIILGAVIAVCATLIGLWNIPWVERLERRIPAIEWLPNEVDYSDPFAVEISGKYYDYLWRDDVFVGTVAIEGYTLNPFPNRIIIGDKPRWTEWNDTIRLEIPAEGGSFVPLTMIEAGKTRTGEAAGCYRQGDDRLIMSFGVTPGMESLQVVVLERVKPGAESYGTACYISAPATTREDAQTIHAAIYGGAE